MNALKVKLRAASAAPYGCPATAALVASSSVAPPALPMSAAARRPQLPSPSRDAALSPRPAPPATGANVPTIEPPLKNAESVSGWMPIAFSPNVDAPPVAPSSRPAPVFPTAPPTDSIAPPMSGRPISPSGSTSAVGRPST